MDKAPALCGVFLVFLLASAATAAEAPQPMTDAAAPAFDLPSLDGERVVLGDLRGKLVVLHFGAGW